jgi:hypothetical protein
MVTLKWKNPRALTFENVRQALRAANEGLKSKLRLALQQRCEQEEAFNLQHVLVEEMYRDAEGASSALDLVSHRLCRLHSLQMAAIENLVAESTQAREQLNELGETLERQYKVT